MGPVAGLGAPALVVAAAAALPKVAGEAIVLLPLAYAALLVSDALSGSLEGRPRLVRLTAPAVCGAALGLVWPAILWMFVLAASALGLAILLMMVGGAVAGRAVHPSRPDGDAAFTPSAALPAVLAALAVRVLA